MSSNELQPIPNNPPLPFKPEGTERSEADILWQVYEASFSKLSNLFEAVPMLIERINSGLVDPLTTEEEKWLFREKGGKPPRVSFMVFENEEGDTTSLTYDRSFTVRALSAGGAVIIRLGRMDNDIYHQYYAAKLRSRTNIFEPKRFLAGTLTPCEDRFVLDSIFLNTWDCRKQFDAAMAIRGFPTEAYETICFLGHYSPEYREQLVQELIKKYGLPSGVKREQLLLDECSGVGEFLLTN